jgi:hypothetical protein
VQHWRWKDTRLNQKQLVELMQNRMYFSFVFSKGACPEKNGF